MSISPPHASLLLGTGAEDAGQESAELGGSSKAAWLQPALGCRSFAVCFRFRPWYQPVARVQRCLGCLGFHTCFVALSSYPPLVSGGRAMRTGTTTSLNSFLTLWDETWAPEGQQQSAINFNTVDISPVRSAGIRESVTGALKNECLNKYMQR